MSESESLKMMRLNKTAKAVTMSQNTIATHFYICVNDIVAAGQGHNAVVNELKRQQKDKISMYEHGRQEEL